MEKKEKIIWRANRVISIETKRKDENRKENLYVQKIEPLKNYQKPKYRVHRKDGIMIRICLKSLIQIMRL